MTTVLSESRSAGNRFAALIENVLREREKIRSVRKTLGLDRADVAKGKTKSDAWRLIGPLRSKDCTARTRRSHGSGATLLRASAHSSACHQRSLHALPCTAQVIECHHEHRRRPQNVLTHYPPIDGVDYIFASVDRYLSGDECDQLHQKYFEAHRKMTAPDEWLFVDLRPAFRKPLSDVTPMFRRLSAEKKFFE